MLLVKTKIKESKIHGIGLFADQFIKKGDIVYIFENDFCKAFPIEDVEKMDEIQKVFIKEYATREDSRYWLDLDNTRFINHSKNPTVEFIDGVKAVAIKDIDIGEEITCNYLVLSKYNADIVTKMETS